MEQTGEGAAVAAPSSERPWYFDGTFTDRPMRLSQLDLDPLQQARVLEWFAFKIWVAAEEGSGSREYHSKSYDPLTIELGTDGGGMAYSYVFDFKDGGRSHPFLSLDELEDWLFDEAIGRIDWAGRWACEGYEENVARRFWREDHPGVDPDDADWRDFAPYYERAKAFLTTSDCEAVAPAPGSSSAGVSEQRESR